jgi:hypothetical protein
MQSEIGRFPRLFQGAGTIPGLTWPTLTFNGELTIRLGKLEVKIAHLGWGIQYEAGIYTGDAHLAKWPATLEKLRAFRPRALVPGRGPALTT